MYEFIANKFYKQQESKVAFVFTRRTLITVLTYFHLAHIFYRYYTEIGNGKDKYKYCLILVWSFVIVKFVLVFFCEIFQPEMESYSRKLHLKTKTADFGGDNHN